MPAWMTPELCPVWPVATSSAFSSTTTSQPGRRSSASRAVARPTMPPPMTMRWCTRPSFRQVAHTALPGAFAIDCRNRYVRFERGLAPGTWAGSRDGAGMREEGWEPGRGLALWGARGSAPAEGWCQVGEDALDDVGVVVHAELVGHCEQQGVGRSEEHTSELQSRGHLVCRLLPENKKRSTGWPLTSVNG